jgi:hypothetical protein
MWNAINIFKVCIKIILVFGIFIVTNSVLAQDIQILDEDGKPISVNRKTEYVNNEIIVNFKPHTIQIPQGERTTTLENIQASNEIINNLKSEKVVKVRKVFRSFESEDTTKVLPSGKSVQTQDLSQFFVLKFSVNINVFDKLSPLKKGL